MVSLGNDHGNLRASPVPDIMEGSDIANSVLPSYPRTTPGTLEEEELHIT